ncbi:MAG: oxygen-independent coproporphyrinogen III oxidase [Bacteroidetes bacterium]|nr:oxygen-independent coproporphyrinogen III oxidase [Bacteroidota bacterium]
MKQFEFIDLDLLKKYDRPGPRYTSYPTAPLFSSDFGADQYLQEILDTNTKESKRDLSLYFHFPFCDTLCYFCGCTMLVTSKRDRISEYNVYLKKEIERVAAHIAKHRKVVQLHWGGGTPSYLEPDEIRDVGGAIQSHFSFAEDIEAGVEIDPRGLTFDHMKAFQESGFNRCSMGVQDFDERVQKAVNRVQPESITRDAVNWARQLGFKSLNLDLIYGLPFQSVPSFEKTLDTIIDISPDRVAVFNYAHVPWLKKHQKLIKPEDLPSLEEKLRLHKLALEKLGEAGYWNIGMDHFAKTDDELAVAQRNKTLYRNFQGYSTKKGCDLYGFGMSAIGHTENTYQQNVKTLTEYYASINENRLPTHAGYRMTTDDHIRKETILRLMCDLEIEKAMIERQFDIRFDEYFADSLLQLKTFEEDGLLELKPDRIVVKNLGRLVIRNMAMCFDAYLEKMMKEKPVFSRTV